MALLGNNDSLGKREIPKINGSSSAFIAVIVILIIIIVISCSAIVYILREDLADDEEALTRGDRSRYQSQRAKYRPSAKSWLLSALRIGNPRITVSSDHSDKTRSVPGRDRKGWFRAGSDINADWDSDAVIDDHLSSPMHNVKNANSGLSRTLMTERDSAFSSPRSSNVGSSYPYIPSSISDAGSSSRFDPHALQGLSYTEQVSSAAQGIIPSIHSQLYSTSSSPSSSSPSPSFALHESSPIGLSPHVIGSSHTDNFQSQTSVASFPDAIARSTISSDSQPQIRKFEGGTKFIEGL